MLAFIADYDEGAVVFVHFDKQSFVQLSPEQTVFILESRPLNRKSIIAAIKGGVVLEFRRFGRYNNGDLDAGGGLLLLSPHDDNKALIRIHQDFSRDEKEEVLYHELVHLHLRRVVNAQITNDNGPEIHPIVVKEGIRLAQEKPIPFWELVALCLYNYIVPLPKELYKYS